MQKNNGHVKVHMKDGTIVRAKLERGSSSNLKDFILVYENKRVESEIEELPDKL